MIRPSWRAYRDWLSLTNPIMLLSYGHAAQDRLVESDNMLRELIGDWTSCLEGDDQEGFLESVRRDSFVNRPLGVEAFVSGLEKRFQLRLARGKVGRPVAAGKEVNN